jgi:hypothetical protein
MDDDPELLRIPSAELNLSTSDKTIDKYTIPMKRQSYTRETRAALEICSDEYQAQLAAGDFSEIPKAADANPPETQRMLADTHEAAQRMSEKLQDQTRCANGPEHRAVVDEAVERLRDDLYKLIRTLHQAVGMLGDHLVELKKKVEDAEGKETGARIIALELAVAKQNETITQLCEANVDRAKVINELTRSMTAIMMA